MIYWFKLFEKYKNKHSRIRLLIWAVAIGIIFFLLGTGSLASAGPNVAVYYFHNQTEDEGLQWLEEDLAVSIDQALSKIEEINYMPLSEVNKIADYQQYENMVQKKDIMLFSQLTNLLQVDLIFSGKYYQEKEGHIDLDLLMYLSSDDYLVEFRRMSSSLEELSDLKEKIIRIILRESGIDTNHVSLEDIINEDTDEEISDTFTVEESPQEITAIEPVSQDNPLALEYYKKAMTLKDKAILEYEGIDFPSKPLWNEAIQNAKKAVEEDPDFAEGYYLLYEIYRRTKWIAREAESLEQYVDIVQRTNRNVDNEEFSELLIRLAHLKYNTGDTSSAINYLEKAISYNRNNVEARSYLMKIYYEDGQGTKALQQAEEIKRIQPDAIELDWFASRTKRISLYGREAFESYESGYKSYIAKDYKEAISHLEEAVRMAPAFKGAHYYLGLSYYHYGKLDAAIHHLEESVRLDSFDNNARIYLNKALEEKEYGRDAVWHFNRGYEHYIAGEYQEALAEFRESTNLNPNFEKSRMYLMRTYYHLGRMDEYAEERKRIGNNVAFTGNMEREYYQLGYDFYSLGDYNKALEKLEEALEINPDYPEARFLIAETLYQLKNYNTANVHYKYVIDNYPSSEYYENCLLGSGWCLYLLEDYQKSEEYLEMLLDDFPDSSLYQEGIYKLGRVYFIQEKYEETINLYEDLMQLESLEYDEVEIKYILGQSYFWVEDYARAKNILLNIIENNPNFNQIDETRYFYSFALFKEEQYNEAMIILEGLAEKENSKIKIEASYLLGRTLIELKEYDRVIRINSSLLDKEIDDNMRERVLFDLGLAYSRKSEDEEAVRYFNRVIDKYPEGKFASLSKIELAQSYYHLGKYQDSIKVLENITTKEALEMKIDSARKLGDEELLVSIYQEFEEKYPDDTLPIEEYYSLAISQLDNNKFREAIDTLKIMENMDMTEEISREVNYWQGLSFYQLREYQQAKEYFQKIDYLLGNEIAIKSLYMLAESFYQQEDYLQAIKYYKEFLQHYSSHSLAENVHYSLAWSYLNEKDYQNALLSFNELIEKNPESKFIEESSFLVGKIQYLMSDNNNSRISLLDFLKDYSNSQYREEAIYIIAQMDLEDQQWIDSIIYFEKLIDEYPDSRYVPGSLYGLCLSYYKKEEYNKALSTGENYLNSSPNGSFVCDVLYVTAICQEELGNMEGASEKYEQIISNCPDSVYVDSARGYLESIEP